MVDPVPQPPLAAHSPGAPGRPGAPIDELIKRLPTSVAWVRSSASTAGPEVAPVFSFGACQLMTRLREGSEALRRRIARAVAAPAGEGFRRENVEAHFGSKGEEVWVHARSWPFEGGVLVEFTERPAAVRAISESRPSQSLAGAQRVLVVDSSLPSQRILRRRLMEEGCTVALASNAAETLQTLRSAREAFDYAFVDYARTESRDAALLARMREIEEMRGLAPAKLVAISRAREGTNQAEMDRADCLAAGAIDFLLKPLSPVRLAQVLKASA